LNPAKEDVPLLTMIFITSYLHQIDIEFLMKSRFKQHLKGRQDKQDESNQRGSELDSDGLSSSPPLLWMKPAK